MVSSFLWLIDSFVLTASETFLCVLRLRSHFHIIYPRGWITKVAFFAICFLLRFTALHMCMAKVLAENGSQSDRVKAKKLEET